MKGHHNKTRTLTDEQVESHIQEWNEKAEAMEKMSLEDAKRFVSKSQLNESSFFQMTMNMQQKIIKEAPSKDAEKRLLKAWKRRTGAYWKMMDMVKSVPVLTRKYRPTTTTTITTTKSTTTTTTSPLDLCKCRPTGHIVLRIH